MRRARARVWTRRSGNVLLPGENARIGPTTADQWLATGAR